MRMGFIDVLGADMCMANWKSVTPEGGQNGTGFFCFSRDSFCWSKFGYVELWTPGLVPLHGHRNWSNFSAVIIEFYHFGFFSIKTETKYAPNENHQFIFCVPWTLAVVYQNASKNWIKIKIHDIFDKKLKTTPQIDKQIQKSWYIERKAQIPWQICVNLLYSDII